MNQSTENDLFGVTLTPSGSTYLLRLYTLARVIFILAILVTLSVLADTWMQNKIYARNYSGLDVDWLTWLSINIYYIFSTIISVAVIVQIYFFFHFSRLCNNAIRHQQTDQFNASFKWLYRNTIWACIMFVLELISRCFVLYSKYWMLQNLHLK